MPENKKKPSLLRRSAGARIQFFVFVFLAAAMAVIVITSRIFVQKYVEEYYSKTGWLLAELTAEVTDNYREDIREFPKTRAGKYLQKICREYDLHGIFVETSEPPYESVVTQVFILGDRDPTPEELEEMWDAETVITDAERKIFLGEETSSSATYTSHFGGEKVYAYLHGVYDTDGKCYALVGVNFRVSEVTGAVTRLAGRVTLFLALVFLGLMGLFGFFLHRSVLGPVRRISKKMREFADSDHLNAEKLPVKGEDEIAYLAESYNTMTGEIDSYIREVGNYVKEVTALQKERLTVEAEMNVASQIQAGMLPSPAYRNGQIRVEAVMKPAKEVAGDFYDYQILPDGSVFFTIADVSGKGVSAALFMAAAVNTVRYNTALSSSPAEILRAANADLCSRNPEMLFVTAFAAVYDPKTGLLTYSNAGHNPPYILSEKRVEALTEADGLLLGLFPEETYTDAEIRIQPGDVLFLYTDGLPEAVNPDRAMYGNERMEQELYAFSCGDPDGQLTQRMNDSMQKFAAGAEAHDDLTMMAVHFGREIVLPADVSENARLRDFLMDEDIPEADRKKVCLAAEEVFVNIALYAYDNKERGTVRVGTLLTDESLTIRFSDSGMPYNPLEEVQEADDYDPDLQLGGLGKLMTVTVMDRQEYEYRDGNNILTLTRRFEEKERPGD